MDKTLLQSKIAAIPAPIREWYSSEKLIEIITELNSNFKIGKDHESVISKVLLRLAIKDLDAEYFAGEIASQLNIEKNNALAITAEIKRTILSPIRKELADYGIDLALIDKFQMPLIKPKVLSEVKMPVPPAPVGPKILSETFSATAIATPKLAATGMPPKPPLPPAITPPQPKPQPVFSQTMPSVNANTSPLTSNKTPSTQIPSLAPQPMKMKPSVGIGWSKQAPQDPIVKLGVITPSMPRPGDSVGSNQPTTSQPLTQKPVGQPTPTQPKGMSEFERLDMMKKGGVTNPANISQAPNIPPPVMLHEISAPGMIQNSPDFRINQGMQNQINRATPPPMPVRSAVIEFGSASSASQGGKPASSVPTVPVPKTVHYSDYKTTIPPGERNITEISAVRAVPAAMPPQPAPPPMPSKPPTPNQNQFQPQTQQSSKVIVKDFLGPEK